MVKVMVLVLVMGVSVEALLLWWDMCGHVCVIVPLP